MSLQVQASRAYTAADVTEARKLECGSGKDAGGRAIRFKNSFMLAFANRIGQRLYDMRKQTTNATPGAELVLYNSAALVRQVFQERNPRLSKGSGFGAGSILSAGGIHGFEAANSADIGSRSNQLR